MEDAIAKLVRSRQSGHHQFWVDSAGLCEPSTIAPRQIAGHQQIPDVYLLAVAVRDQGLATFDQRVPIAAVLGATPQHVAVIPA